VHFFSGERHYGFVPAVILRASRAQGIEIRRKVCGETLAVVLLHLFFLTVICNLLYRVPEHRMLQGQLVS
jgi:hypothetical protein